MNYTFGLIGAGNMGGAIAQAVSREIRDGILSDRDQARVKALAGALGFSHGDSLEAARESRYLFLGIKPHLVGGVLEELAPILAERKEPPVLVSMAAGVSIEQLQAAAGKPYPVIRIMPNTPVAVGQGVILYTASAQAEPSMIEGFLSILAQSGKLYPIEESLMDVGAAVSGCGPAFAYLVMDALADGGVACGLSRPDAIRCAAQTLLGAAQMVLETEKHPDQLKNEVCSPGGSTIQGVRLLEQRGVRAAMMDAVIAACEKNAALGK